MSWVARDGSVVELRDSPVRGLAGYGHALLAFAQYLQEDPSGLWQAVQSELVAEQDDPDSHAGMPGRHIERRGYHAQMARLLWAVLDPEESEPAREPWRHGETESGGKRPTYCCQFCGSTEEDGRPCPKAAEVRHPLPMPATPPKPT